jgi:hypothetical protein
MRFRHTYISVLTTIVGSLSMLARPGAQNTPRPQALIVLDGATDVKFTEDYEGTVKYLLHVPFPADSVIETVKVRLKDQGWVPSNYSAIDPQLATSLLDGWGKYLDGSTLVHIWSGEWKRPDGSNVQFSFSYRFAADEKGLYVPNDRLEVIAVIMSAETIKSLQKAYRSRQ